MKYLIDTNILLCIAHKAHQYHQQVVQCLEILWAAKHEFCSTLQNFAEFWNVCTRPATVRGGLGLTVYETYNHIQLLEKMLTLLSDNHNTYKEWKDFIVRYNVSGVQVHDSRLVAAMKVHEITHLLTLNSKDFVRYSQIIVVKPEDIIVASKK